MSRYVDVPNALLVMPAVLILAGLVAITFDRCMTNTHLTELRGADELIGALVQECVAYLAAAEQALERCERRQHDE